MTLRPAVIDSVADSHPEMAFNFALAHFAEIDALLEADSRAEYIPGLAGQSTELSTIPKLRAYAEAHIPATARQSVVKAEAAISYAAMIRAKRLPEVDRWLKRGLGKRH